MWRVGAKLVHPFNPELGVGVVREVDGRFLVVHFPEADTELRMAAEAGGLERVVLAPGAKARVEASGEEVVVAEATERGYRLSDGRLVDEAELWPLEASETPIARLARLRVDPLRSFANRVAGQRLQALRESGGLGSFLGGRIELFPHQLHTALAAVERDPVRWLLADEVGLGKTIEACLILSALVRTGRANRALVIAPGTLTVQWLGELYRKFHQVFVLLDRDRIDSVESDYGPGVNPFEVHPFGVIAHELLASDRRLIGQARDSALELVVVDEAHGLGRYGHAEDVYPLVEGARHALLLTATPLKADRHGFFELLRVLHPDAFASFADFEAAVESSGARLPCTSAVRRQDLGGLPPRVAQPLDLPALVDAGGDVSDDARAAWIAERVREWLERREKVLVFVHDTPTLERLARHLERATGTHITQFHENMSPARRDLEVARFRDGNTPVLLCSEAGSEGRNFQFCDRMIHWDLPDDPVALEQRIGRLDRIGRTKPVEILYFRCADSHPDVAALYERLDLFTRPSAGLDAALAGLPQALAAAREGGAFDPDDLVRRFEQARRAGARDLPRSFYPDAYDASQADEVLARVPPDLEEKTRAFTLGAARDLGLRVIEKGGAAMYFIELGSGLKVEGLPGVPDEARYLGSFDRPEAIRRDEIEFFASGHPLVEGLLLELEDGPRGRSAVFRTRAEGVSGTGLLCLYRSEHEGHAAVVDAQGKLRPEWCEPLLSSLPQARPVAPDQLGEPDELGARIRSLFSAIEADPPPGQLAAAALFIAE